MSQVGDGAARDSCTALADLAGISVAFHLGSRVPRRALPEKLMTADGSMKRGPGPDRGTGDEKPDRIAPATHSDVPPARPELTTGAGREATVSTDDSATEHTTEHTSGYGGKGGAPSRPSDHPKR